MEFSIKGQAIERFLEEVADAYHDLYPAAHDAFLAAASTESKHLIRSNGMSEQGHFLNLGSLPPHLYYFIRWQARKRLKIDDFFRDPAHWAALFKAWPDAATKRKRTQRLVVPDLS